MIDLFLDNIYLYLNVMLLLVFIALLFFRHIRIACLILLLILPISRDGPLNLNLGNIKFIAASGIAFMALPFSNKLSRSTSYPPISFLLILLAFIVLFAFMLSEVKNYSFFITLYFLISLFMFFIFTRIFDMPFLRQAVSIFLILTFMSCGLAMIQFIVVRFQVLNPFFQMMIPIEFRVGVYDLQQQVGPHGIRLPSFFYHNNGFGHFLSVVFGFQFSMMLYSKKKAEAILYTLAVLAILTSCLLTLSRGTALVIATEAFMILYLMRVRLKRKMPQMLMIGTVFSAVSFFLLETNSNQFFERLMSSGLSYRDINWRFALQLIPRSLPFGTGPGTSSYYILSSFPFMSEYFEKILSDLSLTGQLDWYMSHPHNFYLNAVLETGVFSLIVYTLLICTIIRKGLRIASQNHHLLFKSLAVGATVPLIGCALRGFFESYVFFDSPDVGFLVAFYSALILFLDSLQAGPLPDGLFTQPYTKPFKNLQNLDQKIY